MTYSPLCRGVLILLTVFLAIAVGCGGSASQNGGETEPTGGGGAKEPEVVKTIAGSEGGFMCPMHPDERSDNPDALCSECNMPVEMIPEDTEDEDDHHQEGEGNDHEGHDHD